MNINANMDVAIISEGKYGDRATGVIGKKFNCDFLKINYAGDFEDIEIDRAQLNELKKYDVIITYIINPDLTYALINEIHNINEKLNKKIFVIVGAWRGEGFKKQLESFGNVICPDLMCNLDEHDLKDKLDKYPQLKEFLKYFGKPIVNIYLDNDIIKDMDVIRESPCGSSSETLQEFIGKEFNEKTLIDIGLRVQHFCRAGKLRVFVEKEGKKSRAGKILVNGINIIKK
ncbi:DUF166 family protein [Methanothermococcus sp. Ax23]|uniref:DUF166 family protein n=1 Tax=Methanothermococcus sp. Ax23 TaxID=3156486 RepID=UPI003B9F55F9